MNEIILRQPETEADFEQYFDLRYRILREPWNRPRGTERDEKDATAYHLIACDTAGKILGAGRLDELPEQPDTAQVRWMCVETQLQGQGIGKAIVNALVDEARRLGKKKVFLNAREIAVPFYLSLGFAQHRQEPDYILFDAIPHYGMSKDI